MRGIGIGILIFWCFYGGAQEVRLGLPKGHTSGVSSAVFSPDGKTIVTTSSDKTAKIWDTESGRLLQNIEGHTSSIYSAVFSLDGKIIVTVSGDKTAKIWDAQSGKLLKNLEGHTSRVYSAVFSPDGKTIVTASEDKTAKIWDTESGRLLQNLEGHTSRVNSAFFSPDGKTIVTTSLDETAKIWDTESGRLLQNIEGHTSSIYSAVFSLDGKIIVTVSGDKTAKIWDAQSGKLLKNLEGHTSRVYSAVFSPDGKTIVTASEDETAKIWDAESGRLLQSLEGHTRRVYSAVFSPDGKIIVTASEDGTSKIWDAKSGRLMQNLEGHTSSIYSAVFSPDGKTIVTTSLDETAKIWDTESGRLLQNIEGHTSSIYSAVFSPDGKTIVTASGDETTRIWDTESGKLLQNLEGHTSRVNSAVFSPDGKTIVTASEDGTSKISDAESGRLLQNLGGHTSSIYSAVFSPDGKTIVTASRDKTAKIWDAESGKLLQNLEGHTDLVKSAVFSLDGKTIVTASWDRTAKIWEASTGGLLQNLEGPSSVESAVFSPDGKTIVTTSLDETAKIWDTESGMLMQNLEGHTSSVNSAFFSPDGKTIVTASRDETAKIWDTESGKLLQNLEGHTSDVYSAVFSPDGKTIVTASWDETAKIWDVESGKLLQNLEGHDVYSAFFSSDGKTIVTASSDETVIWDATTGKKLYTLLQLKNGDWLVYDEYYHYDGTSGARDYLYFVCGLEVIDIAQVKDALYVPNLVQRIMQGQEINYPKLSELQICDAFPVIEQGKGDRGEVLYEITPRNLGLKEVEVYVNSKRVAVVQKEQLERESTKFMLRLNESDLQKHFLSGFTNTVEVIGVVEDGGAQLRSRGSKSVFEAEEKDATPPTIYGVFVGVKNYKDPALNLGFTAKDAQDLRHAFSLSAKKFLGEANVETYLLHNDFELGGMDGAPQRESIRKTLEDIGKKARPQDVVLLFFAGHGEMQGNEDKYFTLLTEEAGKNNFTGISTKDLTSWLSYDGPHKMLANKTILILDACNSGQATKELMAMARNDDESRRIRQVEDLKDKSGMFIFTASAANQAAYEMPQYQQGLLTYSLLHTLKNDGSVLDEGGLLNLQKWFLQSERYLKEMVERHGLQQQAQPFGTANIDIAKVDDEVRNSIILVGEKATVVLENVLNTSIGLDDLDLKGQLAKELASISQRGTSSINFVQQNITDAYKINIVYTTKDGKLDATLRLVKGKSIVFEQTYKKMTTEGLLEVIVKDVKLNAVK